MFKKISLYKRVVVFVFLLTGIPFIFTACGGNPQTAAKAKLEKQNITVSPQSLFQAIKMGDVPNTFLLLEAGIDVNIRVDDKTPLIAAISSMQLLVVSASKPESSFSPPRQRINTPQPPGPGLPRHAPSV